MNKTNKHIVYSNYDYEEIREAAIENILDNAFFMAEDETIEVIDNFNKTIKVTREEYKNAITEEAIINEMNFLDSVYIEDEQDNLKYCSEGSLIAIASIGRWTGRCSGYKELDSLDQVLYTNCDYEEIYVDSNGDLRKDESHHDGTNTILYRYWKDNITEQQKENFMNKIYMGTVTTKDISRYTRKAGVKIANTYGWTVRGGENKYKSA